MDAFLERRTSAIGPHAGDGMFIKRPFPASTSKTDSVRYFYCGTLYTNDKAKKAPSDYCMKLSGEKNADGMDSLSAIPRINTYYWDESGNNCRIMGDLSGRVEILPDCYSSVGTELYMLYADTSTDCRWDRARLALAEELAYYLPFYCSTISIQP